MKTYDPNQIPNPELWAELDEAVRLELVSAYHQSSGIDLPNITLHAAFHTIVENQLAEGLDEVHNTLDRLLEEGLDRHDAIHAIGSVVVGQVHGILQDSPPAQDQSQAYFHELDKLTAKKWLQSGK